MPVRVTAEDRGQLFRHRPALVPGSVTPDRDERRAGSARSRRPSCPAVNGWVRPGRREARTGVSGPAVLSAPGAISSDRDYG